MKIIFNASICDLIHEGHLNLYRKMREAGDYTIVVLHDDLSAYQIKAKVPVHNLEQRIANIKLTGLIDRVIVSTYPDPANEFEQIIKGYGPKHNLVYMRGNDLLNFPGKRVLKKYGVPIKFVPYTKGVSSTEIKKDLLDHPSPNKTSFLSEK